MSSNKCVEGETFAVAFNETCRKCSQCPKDAHLVQKCTLTQDSLCACEKGFFLSTVSNECKPCTPCPHGWGVWRQCSRNRNAVCRKCPPGTYSGVLSGTLGCFLCKSCRSDQILLQECSPIQDTICVDASITEIRHFSTSSSNAEENEILQLNDGDALPIYIGVLAVIVCFLIFYVFCHWRLKNVMKTPSSIINTSSSGYLLPNAGSSRNSVNYSPLAQNVQRTININRQLQTLQQQHQHYTINHAFSEKQQQRQTRTGERIFGMPHHFTAAYRFPEFNSLIASNHRINAESAKQSPKVVRYCDLNSTKKRALEASLNPLRNDGRDWKGLAKELGTVNCALRILSHPLALCPLTCYDG
ncbi:tumor necrosis factor receptor superfamily member 16-like protein [Dinothrombium tinctorium]|uniref:Tumor necrosis factor receptor superfamily member 16-like protein n=1 Tax=Dinothrombium tinctorium TaxID=1965070 RepID=A0A443RQ57_9ACAR|nr:tumor necrosis factor receptor superfamily member 16-like protein [Dinothrombium tinctorium]